ncbi:hypothetical protein VTK73DRAFT_4850 [Phialemonium thermophilum]|uniref:Zn(2)-C6 fungal-type domain-containing protein n=1 Tax=Phialemonium thermophilum TaxID=223376 RepID=A0ABR3WS38_9PEZI
MTMSSGRPPKRPSPTPEDPVSPGGRSKSKLPRLERPPQDFSKAVQSKLKAYTRTGQACDRCKVRKIRCDGLLEGCSPCTSQNLVCYVTNRNTGQTERRGYVQQLEREKQNMLRHIKDLETLLRRSQVEVRPWEEETLDTPASTGSAGGPSYGGAGPSASDTAAVGDEWTKMGSVWVKKPKKPHRYFGGPSRYTLLETRPSASYLGVMSDSAPLSSVKGTTLSVLGKTIDITSFDAPDMDEPAPGTPIGSPLYNKSVMAFLQSTLNVNPPGDTPDLPTRQDAFTYTEWYFLMVQPFMPVLHKPSFLNLLSRIYDDASHQPTIPEMVTVRMSFAIIYFQYGIRNREDPQKQASLNLSSNGHYHWCLSKFFDLMSSDSVTAVQALAMIAIHTRSFPKPGCAAMAANAALTRAIELNLHRAAAPQPDGVTNITNEVRKRVWWACLALAVTVNGRLGRPMPISLEEFDAEFPIAVPDEYLTDEGITDASQIGHCPFMVGLMEFKVVPLYLEMYSNIYSVRRDPTRYVDIVLGLEEAIRELEDNLPDELQLDKCKPGSQIYALYTQAFCLEFRLCLRHPSVCMTKDAQFCAENIRICEETVAKLVKVVGGLLQVKSLDTTWYQLSVYVAAIFTTLLAHWLRRHETSPQALASLKEQMAMWMSIVQEMGRLMGSGPKISNEVNAIINKTVAWIEHDMRNRDGGNSYGQQGVTRSRQPGFAEDVLAKQQSSGSLSNGGGLPAGQRMGRTTSSYFDTAIMGQAGTTTGYPSSLSFADQPGPSASPGSIPTQGPYGTADHPFLYGATTPVGGQTAGTAGSTPSLGFIAHTPAGPSMPLASHAQLSPVDSWRTPVPHQHQASHSQSQAPPQMHAQAAAAAAASLMTEPPGNNPWQDWTAAITDPQTTDRYGAAALLNLGTARTMGESSGAGDVGPMGSAGDASGRAMGDGADIDDGGASMLGGGPTQAVGQWPLLLFSAGSASAASSV